MSNKEKTLPSLLATFRPSISSTKKTVSCINWANFHQAAKLSLMWVSKEFNRLTLSFSTRTWRKGANFVAHRNWKPDILKYTLKNLSLPRLTLIWSRKKEAFLSLCFNNVETMRWEWIDASPKTSVSSLRLSSFGEKTLYDKVNLTGFRLSIKFYTKWNKTNDSKWDRRKSNLIDFL